MATPDNPIQHNAHWQAQRPELINAYGELTALIEANASSQDLLDAYLRMKRLSASVFQSLLLASIPDHGAAWVAVRQSVEQRMQEKYAGLLPEWALKVPYGSAVHKQLFCILIDRQGAPVPGDYLRIVTADAVHAERRVRELRELGLDVIAAKASGNDTYSLDSARVNLAVVPTIVVNTVRANKKITEEERKRLQAIAEEGR
ncbi:hypothetical protein [Kineococcus sp. SYSU DK006]|uniref:hypothetical protein n=1 Tax=Kineococcus sp. SYSU DK006 TaxID=3383127 RepID=UPI003D7E2712